MRFILNTVESRGNATLSGANLWNHPWTAGHRGVWYPGATLIGTMREIEVGTPRSAKRATLGIPAPEAAFRRAGARAVSQGR